MLEALQLACSCQEGDHGGVRDKARRAFPPKGGRGSRTSFSTEVLGSAFQEGSPNRWMGGIRFPPLHAYCLLASLFKLKLAKPFKPVARSAEGGLSKQGQLSNPACGRPFLFAVLCLPKSLGWVGAGVSLCSLRSSLPDPR